MSMTIDAQGNHHRGKGTGGGQFATHGRTDPEGSLTAPGADLSTADPVDVDTALAGIFERAWKQGSKVEMIDAQIIKLLQRERAGRSYHDDTERLAMLRTQLNSEQATLDAIHGEAAPFELEFQARGGWSRAFLVTGGHLHRSMDCSTCNRDGKRTQFHWLPEYSGQDEGEIVTAAGSRVCTVCYPSAPVDVLRRPSAMLTPDEKAEKEARDRRVREKAERDAARAEKALLPDGGELREPGGYGAVKTLVSARRELTDAIIDSHVAVPNEQFTAGRQRWRDMLIDAIAAKTAVPADDVRAEAYEKARAKMKREYGQIPTW